MKENITIEFELKSPEKYPQSIMNTIVLLLDEIRMFINQDHLDEIGIQIFNETIEITKSELDNLKVIIIEQK